MKTSIKKIVTILFLAFSIFYTVAAQNNPDRIIGLYFSPQKDGKISIYKRGNHYYGKLVWAVKNVKDHKNPDATQRTRDLIGSDLMTGFKYSGKEYVDGKIYDPTSGKSYDCKMWLSGNQLNVRGFMGLSMFGRTEIFTRIG